ncbi:NB-ARC domain-containing protein [Reticulomyxa filosa]|uniref:NB-ARC domain-containing protein n=1 Tax=Reticulomyxa filosa TaxID=46433 RepID=X6NV31_RETFI|nr:NB-ARC domain-containing protein [Reticulomyxa filosa]|eukprot:ETO29132.1 NB-ARC domain-containing protein [Reticulomyxa filosa]
MEYHRKVVDMNTRELNACFLNHYFNVNNNDEYICIDRSNTRYNAQCLGGMQDNNITSEEKQLHERKMKILTRLFENSIDQEELQQKMRYHNGNIELVINDIVQQAVEKEKQQTNEESTGNASKQGNLQKEMEKTEIGEIKPGINLQGYCSNESCLASKAKLAVWVNIGFENIRFISDKTSLNCPDCKKETVTYIIKAMFYNSEYSININNDIKTIKDNNYESIYSIKEGIIYELKANKIKQHAKSIEDLRERSEKAMNSIEIKNLIIELQKYEITVVKPENVKGNERLLEKIRLDYDGDFNEAFDIGRFTILCDNSTKLQTAVAVMKKAEQFNLIVSEDKDYFNKLSKTHHRFHNIKLYIKKYDVYIEMQATLKNYTTLEGYTIIENPKLSHLFYEYIRSWKSNNILEEELKQYSNQTLNKINDIICEWIDIKEIQKISNNYKSHSEIKILKPLQLKDIKEEDINLNNNNNIYLKLIQFIYNQLCNFNPKQIKGKAIYVILFEYFKKYIIGEMNPASCYDIISILKESRKKELEEDITILQALETYIPLQANNYQLLDNDNNDNNDNKSYDCHQYIIDLLSEEKKNEQQIIILQGKSGSGKSLFCRHLEEILWESYINHSLISIPIYISLSKFYNPINETQLISQALQIKQINKEIIDIIRKNISFIFILDGFDEIFDKYYKYNHIQKYFYDRFNLNQWNANIIISCRSHVLNDQHIQQIFFNSNNHFIKTTMTYLWPFSKEQMRGYIHKFVQINHKNQICHYSNWTPQQYEETLQNYPNLHKMMEEPFLLRLILTVLPSLMKQHSIGTNISKVQVYEAFNQQWIDFHVQNISNKLAELRIQTNPNKIKSAFQQYCHDLGFQMFIQGTQIATENDDIQHEYDEIMNISHREKYMKNIESIDGNIDTKINEIESPTAKTKGSWKRYFYGDSIAKYMSKRTGENNTDEKVETKVMNENGSIPLKADDAWKQFFKGDSVAKYVLRRVGDNKYQFLHKSCQEYFAAQKIIFDILSWKPNIVNVIDMDNQQFQQQFETHIQKLSINYKLLNEELGIIQFIADRIHDINPIFADLKSRLFRIIEASKSNEDVSIAAANAITILNLANVNMHYQNWSNIKIPYAILDHAFLEGTNFNHANLNGVSFYQAFLNKTNFTNASMNGIYFGEYAALEGHLNDILEVQFSPDGTKIVSCSRDKTIRIWDASSGRQLQLLEGHTAEVNTVQFSPDGSKIVSCSRDKTLRMWNVSSGQQIQIWKEHSGSVKVAQFSHNGAKIVSCSQDKTIRIWDVLSGKRVQILEGHSGIVQTVRFSPDDSKIVSCSWDKTIRIWNAFSGEQIQILEGHLDVITDALFSSNGSMIISYSEDKIIRIWDVLSGRQIQILEGHSGRIKAIQLLPENSKLLSCSDDKTIRIWDLLSGKQIQILEGHSDSVSAAKFSPDGSRIVSGSRDRTIRIWDVSSGKQLQVLEGHLFTVAGVQFFPKDPKILSYSNDGKIRIWDLTLERKIQLTEGHLDTVTGVQFSADGSKIVSSSWDKTIRLWNVLSGRLIQTFEGHFDRVNGVQFSLDSSKIISYSYGDKTIRIWDTLSGKQLHVLEGHSNIINYVQSSPDGSKIVSCSNDNTIRIWDILSGKQLQLLEGHSSWVLGVQFSPDCSKIASCSRDTTIRLWDVFSGKQIQSFEGHIGDITSVQFSPDGYKLMSCSYDKTIRLWDISSGKQLLLLEGHSNWVRKAYFSSDGSKIVSNSWDNTVRLWDVSSGKLLQSLNPGHVLEAQFSSDCSKIFSYSDDKTIRIWDASSGRQIHSLEGHSGRIFGMQLSPDGSKIVSCSEDRTIRLWGSGNSKIIDITDTSFVKCIWQVGVQRYGLSMKDSVWKNTNGLTSQQKLLVEQRNGKF